MGYEIPSTGQMIIEIHVKERVIKDIYINVREKVKD
jgi:hypothetical protein